MAVLDALHSVNLCRHAGPVLGPACASLYLLSDGRGLQTGSEFCEAACLLAVANLAFPQVSTLSGGGVALPGLLSCIFMAL